MINTCCKLRIIGVLFLVFTCYNHLSFAQQTKEKNCRKAMNYLDLSKAQESPKAAILYADSAKPFVSDCSSSIQWSVELQLVGSYRQLNNYNKAREICARALYTFRDSEPVIRALILNQMSLNYNGADQLDLKAKYLKACVELSREHSIPELPVYLANYAEVLLLQKRYDAALTHIKESKALDSMIVNEQRDLEVCREVILARIYDAQGDETNFLKTIDTCRVYCNKNPYSFGKLVFWVYWGMKVSKRDNYEEALAISDSIFYHADLIGLVNAKISGHKVAKAYYKRKNDFESAVFHLEQIQDLETDLHFSRMENIDDIIQENAALFKAEFQLKEDKLEAELQIKKQRHERAQMLNFGLGIILFLGCLAFLFYLRQRRISVKKKELESEQKSITAELQNKNGELTNYILKVTNSNSFLQEIAQDLGTHNTKLDSEKDAVVNRVIQKIERQTDKAVWKEFELRFQQVHKAFYAELLQSFPSLTYNERRLSSFIKLGLNVKDISGVTGQSPNSIRVARIRLRKKFGITNTQQSLEAFIDKFG